MNINREHSYTCGPAVPAGPLTGWRIQMGCEILGMHNIKKQFQGTYALKGVDFSVVEGEVHVLLGENGAGKSTLMKILSGVHQPDYGKICWHGREVNLKRPSDALDLGIGMVYQELMLLGERSVFENIWIGRMPRIGSSPFVDWKEAENYAKRVFKELEIDIDVSKRVSEYDLGIQQLVEIIRATSRDANLVILDEPASALTGSETGKLFSVIRKLKSDGVSFIYITHKMSEVFDIGDRVTVLRDGNSFKTINTVEEICEDDLVEMMVGRRLDEQYPKQNNITDEIIFSVDGLSDYKHFHEISFELRKGEVLGIAGLAGSGQTELLKAMFGLGKIRRGRVRLGGVMLGCKSPASMINKKFGLVTKDRREGLFANMSVLKNIIISSPEVFSRGGFRNRKKEFAVAGKLAAELGLDKTADLENNLSTLSGGNQQKIALAKWLCNKTRVFFMDDPARGVDVGAKVEFYKIINQITCNGGSVILVSSDMAELLEISDNVLVMKKGCITGKFKTGNTSREELVRMAAGA